MVDLSKGKALSGAEITETIPHERDRFHQLMKFAEKGVRPSGKKGDLINGVAAFQAEQFRIFERLGHFHLDKPTLDDDTGKGGQDVMDDTWNNSQDTQIVERDISSSPSGTTRQFTIALSVSQEETKTLAPLSGLAMPAITPCQQSTIVNFSSIPRTLSKGTPIKQRPLKATFLDNIDPPFFHSPLPGPNKQFHSTRQLAFGRHLLLTKKMLLRSLSSDSQVTVEDGRLVMGLEETDRVWIRAIMKDTIEQDRLCWLTTQVVSQFLKSNHKDAQSIAEVILLGSVLDRQDFRRVLSSLFQQLEQGPLLDPELLKGIMYFLQSALPGHLIDDDLVRILRVLRKRLEETHIKFDNTKKLTSAHVYLLTMAVSRVVDMMVEGNVHGLNRTEDQRPLLSLFAGLRDSADFYLNNQATYVCQALQYIGDDESPLNMTLRVGSGLVMAGLGVASVFRLDIGGLFNGLRELGNAAGQVLDATNALFDSIQIARNAGEGIINSVLKGFQNGEKRAWYPALQGARVFIREGRVADFKRLVYEAPCCREIEFQWCICQLLGEMAMDLIWGTEIRQQAIYLLEDLYNSDSGWIEDSSVRVAICGILLCIHQNAEKILSVSVDALSLSRKWDNGSKGVEPYPLISRLLTPESSPLLARALMVPSSEYKLHRMMAQRFEALQQQVYIPPHAKANLKALDDEYFPLMDKVLEFLASDRQVFLILGNSGSGKSTFIKHVSSVLMKDYDQGSPIPLFIYLPDIKNSSTGLISEQLQILGFTEDDIQELKRDRLFVIFCDSYDESQLSINLHTSNMLNHPGQWNAKMIISCRSTHARRDYLDRFQPQSLDRYGPPTPHLFQEAVIVPFSSSQIKDYVDQFVQHKVIDKLLSIPVIWSASEYMDKLTRIPNLLQLVTNPFLLKLALKSLPVVFKNDNCDPSTVTITRPKLFGMFIEDWLEVNRKRLISMELSKEARAKLDELIDGDFKTIAINFLQDLAKDIYEKQAGHSVVQYIHRVDKGSWKSKFFGPDEETTLLRQSSPLTCVENLHSFIHRSLLEYFRSLQMTRLVVSPNNGWENGLSSSGSSDPGKISFYPGGPLANQPTKNHRSGLGVQSIHENPRLSMGHGPPNYAPVTPSLPPSTTTTPHRKTDQGAMNSIEATVKKFLVPVKQLQEGLTLWSTQKMTAAQILDIFVQLTTQFNLVSKSFHEVGIDTSELAPIVDDLRGCLETALGEAPSPASLHLYLSRIKEVIINLLQGISLKKNVYREQYKARTARTQGTSATTPTPTTSLPLPATTATTTTPSTISPSIRRVRTSVSAGQQLHQQQHVQQQQQLQKRQQRPSHSAPSRSYTQQLQQRYFQGHQVAQLTSTSSFPSSPAWPANMNGGTPEMEMPSLDYSNGSSAAPSCFPPHLQKLQEIEQSPHMTPPSPSLSSPQYGDLSGLSDDFFVASVLNIIPTNMPPIAHFDYLSEFRQRQRIATGGNGEIRRAFWPLHQTFVILKSLIDTEHKTEKIIKLFDKEVEVMSQCKQHDNIAQFYGIAIRNSDDDREGDRFMIMQYYELGNLTKLLEKPKNLPEAPTLTDKLYLAMDIAVGLDHLLKCGYHHGDLHPKNILIDLRPNAQPNQGRYRARLTDFGLQRIRDNKNQASSKQFGGVWQFMAPERMSKHRPRYDIRCDIFALGVLYWFILAGRYPFKDPSNFSPGMREGRIDGTPEWFYQIYTKAWSEDPDDRQQTFEEIARSFWYNLRIPLASSQVVETLRKSDAITHRASSRRHSQQFLTLLEQNPPLVPQRRPILDLNILDPGGCALTLEEEGEVRAAPNSGNDWSSTPLATTSSSLSFISNEHELPIAAVDPVVDSSSPAPRDPAKASINDRIQRHH
ncbi:Bud site selection protein 6 [Gryganskiella cystojenkinii]|nr:Bud site selection protein 6 [Gryganskiella cystojenkinii]